MAQAATTNFFLHFGGNYNVQIMHDPIGTSRRFYFPQSKEIIMSSRQAIFAFILAVLLNFLQLKYQGKAGSPFETHPKTILVGLASLFIYCLSYDATLRFSTVDHGNTNSKFASFFHISMAIFGPLLLASISSILFNESLSRLLYSIAILFSLFQIPQLDIAIAWKRLRAAIKKKFCHQESSRTGMVSIQVPWLPTVDQVDICPV